MVIVYLMYVIVYGMIYDCEVGMKMLVNIYIDWFICEIILMF